MDLYPVVTVRRVMGSKTVYNAPKIEKDDSFEKYLEYQKERETKLEERAQQEREDKAASELRRRQTGAKGLTGLYNRTKGQLESGLINFDQAQNQLSSYIDKYDLTSGFKEGEAPEGLYTDATKGPNQYLTNLQDFYQGEGGLQSQKRTAGVQLAYRDLLGREATADELSGAMSNLNLQAYGGAGIQGLRDSIKSGSEYTKKFNDNYLDNYYDTMYGKQTVDEEGNRTKKRTFTFDASLLPTYEGNLKDRTGVGVTSGQDFSDYFGKGRTIAELEEGKQNIRDTRKFLYSAGLTNLQGEIDKETQKIKNEGAKDIAKIQQATNMYTGLLGGFNF